MWLGALSGGEKMIGAEDSSDAVFVAVFSVAWVVLTPLLCEVRTNIQKFLAANRREPSAREDRVSRARTSRQLHVVFGVASQRLAEK